MKHPSNSTSSHWQETVYIGVLAVLFLICLVLVICLFAKQHQVVHFLSQVLTGLMVPIFAVAIGAVTITYLTITSEQDSAFFRRQCLRWFKLYVALGLMAMLVHNL